MSFDPNAYAREQEQRTTGNGKAHAEHGPMVEAPNVEVKPVDWTWYPYLPAGMISILGAPGGAGKGLICTAVAAAVTTGGTWPCSTIPAQRGHVLWCEAEDPLSQVVLPRLIAAGAEREFVTFANREQFLACDLRQFIKDRGTRLIVLSPMPSFLQFRDLNGEMDVRAILERLQAAIEGLPCAVLGIAHTNKKPDLRAVERILGSVAFVNFVRSVLLVGKDRDDEQWWRFAHAKMNVGVKGGDLLCRPEHVGQDPRDQFVKVVWQLPEEDCDVDAMFDRNRSNGQARGKQSAGQWLVAYLREHGESLRVSVVLAGEEAGHKENAIRKAFERNDAVQSRRDGFQGPVYWSL